MLHTTGKRRITGVVIGALVVCAIALFAWSFLHPFSKDEEPAANQNQQAQPQPASDPVENTEDDSTVKEAETPTIDPETVSSVSIDSLAISVSYVKGIEGFSYSVNQSGGGTKFVDFSAEPLKGTKCTDDEGVFATIVQGADSAEDQTTLTLTKVVSGTTYGLSLPSNTCTSDTTLFAAYQSSFKDAFGLLKAL